jgi:hypothetical protein
MLVVIKYKKDFAEGAERDFHIHNKQVDDVEAYCEALQKQYKKEWIVKIVTMEEAVTMKEQWKQAVKERDRKKFAVLDLRLKGLAVKYTVANIFQEC